MPHRDAQPPRMPGPSARRWIGLAVAAFLVIQLLLPLRYYLNAPTPDERFAWRMFSSFSARNCVATLYQVMETDGRRVEEQVPPLVLAPWKGLLGKNRPDLVEKMMRACCRRPGVIGVRFKLACTAADGTELPAQQWWMDSRTNQMRSLDSTAP